MSAAETIAKSTTIIENGGSAVASVNGKIGVVELNYTDVGAPPSSRTINGKSLEEDITLTAQDVGALTTEDIAGLETQVTTNTAAIGTLDSRTGNHADAIMALQNEVDEHTLQSEIMFLQRDRVPNLVDNSDFSIWFGGALIENALTITEGPTKWYGNGNLYRTYSKISRGCRITTNTSGTYVGIQQRVPTTKLHAGAYTIIWNFTTSADCVSYQRNTIAANTPTTEIIHITITDEHITQGYYSLGSCGIYSLADGSNIPEGFYFDIENVAMYEGTYTLDNYPTYIKPNIRLEAIKCGVPMNPRNLLDNSWFVNPIHQRGATEYTGLNTYTIDRWYVGGNNNKITLGNDCVKAETTIGSSYATIAQKVANCTQYAGKTLTFAACVRSNVTPRIYVYNGDTGIEAVVGTSGDYQVLVCTFTVPSDIAEGALSVKIQSKSTTVGDYIEAQWAALYEGAYTAETLPAYQYKGYAVELAECMRYYQKGGQAATVGTQYGTETKGIIRLRFTNMRIMPTITILSVASQGWGNIETGHLTAGWSGQCGYDYFQNYIIEGDASFIGQTIGVEYEASADL